MQIIVIQDPHFGTDHQESDTDDEQVIRKKRDRLEKMKKAKQERKARMIERNEKRNKSMTDAKNRKRDRM